MSNNSDYSDYYDSDYEFSCDSIDSEDEYYLQLEGMGIFDSAVTFSKNMEMKE
jgi:hypothetical protein